MAVQPEFVVVAGMSGAGRSTVADALEDLGWFVIDNLPPSLIPGVAELAGAPGSAIERLALVVGTHQYHEDLMPALAQLRDSGARVRIVFLDAPTDVLIRRFDDTRRRHPLDGATETVIEAIEDERALLEPVRHEADMVIDTGDLIVHELKARIVEAFTDVERERLMRTTVMSFGYKHGVPRDVDLVLDCRFLPNPHWVSELRPKTGLDDPVREYVLGQPATSAFLERLMPLLDTLLPAYVAEGKAYLTIALGCTGGRHRSVAIAEEVSRLLRSRGHEIRTRHRDIDR
jgi:UPF0042 nucleotide-binding protein